MKKLIIITATIFALTSCNRIEKEKRVLIKGNNDSLVVINIPTATCKNCQKVIEEGLAVQKGVKQSILDLNTKKVSIVYDPKITNYEMIEVSVNKLIPKMPCN